jgi:hypothetical protein
MSLINNNGLQRFGDELGKAFFIVEGLVSSHCPVKDGLIIIRAQAKVLSTYTSAKPEALYFEPCSISTDQLGKSRAT